MVFILTLVALQSSYFIFSLGLKTIGSNLVKVSSPMRPSYIRSRLGFERGSSSSKAKRDPLVLLFYSFPFLMMSYGSMDLVAKYSQIEEGKRWYI